MFNTLFSKVLSTLALLGFLASTSSIALADNALQRITVEEVTSLMAGKQAARFRGFLEKINLPGLEKVELMKDPVYVHRALTTRLNDRALNPALAKEISKIRKLNRTASNEANHNLDVRSSGSGAVTGRGNNFVGPAQTKANTIQAFEMRMDEMVAQDRVDASIVKQAKSTLASHADEADVIGRGIFTLCGEFTPDALNTYLTALINIIEAANTAAARSRALTDTLVDRTGVSRAVAQQNNEMLRKKCEVYAF